MYISVGQHSFCRKRHRWNRIWNWERNTDYSRNLTYFYNQHLLQCNTAPSVWSFIGNTIISPLTMSCIRVLLILFVDFPKVSDWPLGKTWSQATWVFYLVSFLWVTELIIPLQMTTSQVFLQMFIQRVTLSESQWTLMVPLVFNFDIEDKIYRDQTIMVIQYRNHEKKSANALIPPDND